jgi:hypothetical protein
MMSVAHDRVGGGDANFPSVSPFEGFAQWARNPAAGAVDFHGGRHFKLTADSAPQDVPPAPGSTTTTNRSASPRKLQPTGVEFTSIGVSRSKR